MLSKQIELADQTSIQLNALLMSIQSFSESSENSGLEEVEENQVPAIQNLYQEANEPHNDTIKNSCEAAIANYMKCLPEERGRRHHPVSEIEHLQQQVVDTLQSHLIDKNRISVIEDCRKPCTCCFIVPPYLLQKIYQIEQVREDLLVGQVAKSGCVRLKDRPMANQKIRNLTARVARRSARHAALKQHSPKAKKSHKQGMPPPAGQGDSITVYDAQHKEQLPGKWVASNATHKKAFKKLDSTAKKVLEAASDVHQFWLKNFNLNSFDGKGSEIKSTIHYGHHFANAFWNGEQMVFGDGDQYLHHLTNLSIVGHEFGHAITGNKLNYEGEAGALNEHLSDVWGSLAEQYKNKQNAQQASWLIGSDSLKIGKKTFALRSMKNPGTAYDSPILGKDPQPNHYSQRYTGLEDNGGVHINSGIPNKAFCLFAMTQGGYAWEKAGRLWFLTLQTDGLIHPNCTMREFAQATIHTALTHFPKDYKMHKDLVNAWKAVGLA